MLAPDAVSGRAFVSSSKPGSNQRAPKRVPRLPNRPESAIGLRTDPQVRSTKIDTPTSVGPSISIKIMAPNAVSGRESAYLPSKPGSNQKTPKAFPKPSNEPQPQVNHKTNMRDLIGRQVPGVKHLRELREDYIAIFDTFITKHKFKYVLRMQPNVAWWQEGRRRALIVKCQLDETNAEKLLDILSATADPMNIDEVCFHLDFLPLTYIVREHVRNQLMESTKFTVRENSVSISSMYQLKRERSGGNKIQSSLEDFLEDDASCVDALTGSASGTQPDTRAKSSLT